MSGCLSVLFVHSADKGSVAVGQEESVRALRVSPPRCDQGKPGNEPYLHSTLLQQISLPRVICMYVDRDRHDTTYSYMSSSCRFSLAVCATGFDRP
ncbi:uncharacterized protein BO66DRAFT_54841 [Aspergillus aculeatinus CBS 121060]|uniref:Uncharacterized protein n=1 Tax=Aspergillus aculeatinus CBS 121060 TaxID=1448322 RepID=A0ACD1HDV7_9EURO|nr:hypothetical protein BO66DRAFT_54841 [Aspergillus aculeatinus CBS 121060]RAH71640.1 hypothetical protein BO66DRAFT_54841 [Aspergillus aculeatinus CBS 121060]